jgi:hypothetical protein
MATCDNCKWWSLYHERACDFVDTVHSTVDASTLFTIEATASDDTGLEARLITGPKFGCIKFAPKQKA